MNYNIVFYVLYVLFWHQHVCVLSFRCKPRIIERSVLRVSTQEERTAALEKRRKKKETCYQMPLSQSWYKDRAQHLSKNQRRTLTELWPTHGIDLKYGTMLCPDKIFNSTKETWLDLGFGSGDSLVFSCQNLGINVIGVEIHRASIANTLQKIDLMQIQSAKLIRADVFLLLSQNLQDSSLNGISIFFPDPWPNADRDIQRRVVRENTMELFSKKIQPYGFLRIATDVEDYAQHVRSTIKNFPNWKLNNEISHRPCENIPFYRPITKYEMKAAEKGHSSVWDFEYQYIP